MSARGREGFERLALRGPDLRRGDVLVQELYRDGVYARDGEHFEVLRVTVGPKRVTVDGYLESTGRPRRMSFGIDDTFVVERAASASSP